jgi:hypothetical protein
MGSTDNNLIFEQYKQVNESIGLGPNGMSTVTITVGSNTSHPPRRQPGGTTFSAFSDEEHEHCEDAENGCTCDDCPECSANAKAKAEDEMVYIQSGDTSAEDHACNSEHDGEVDMARAELLKAAEYATKLFNHLENIESLEGWTASKITKASDYLSSVYHALEYDALDANVEDEEDDIEIDEFDGTEVAKKTGFA